MIENLMCNIARIINFLFQKGEFQYIIAHI